MVGRTEAIHSGGGEGRDPLTGLRDGRAARGWIAGQLAGAVEATPALVVLLLSVSRYDAINAAFGRATGDAVLQAAARRIERHVGADARPKLVARMAGAEFAVLLGAPATLGEGRFLAGQLVEAIGRPFASGDHVITIGCRAGVAAAEAGDDPARLLRRASAALAEAGGDGSPVRVLEEGRRKRDRARRPARGRPAPRARPGRDRDPLPAAGVGRPTARSSASRRSPAGSTLNMASLAR